jgi:hypothetical protein
MVEAPLFTVFVYTFKLVAGAAGADSVPHINFPLANQTFVLQTNFAMYIYMANLTKLTTSLINVVLTYEKSKD